MGFFGYTGRLTPFATFNFPAVFQELCGDAASKYVQSTDR